MLVLSRQLEEEIVIGNDIRVKVLSVSGNSVRLGITAPQAISVHRSEIHDEICRQNQVAAAVTTQDLSRMMESKQWAVSKEQVTDNDPATATVGAPRPPRIH